MRELPAWGQAEMPEPLPYNFKNVLRVIGPGAILLATSIGGGEWLVGPATGVKLGIDVMWIATIGIILQVLFNLEAVRYTLYTGEPIFSGIMRLRPGATFWGTTYIVLAAAQLGVPALASACGNVLFTAWQGRLPEPADASTTLWITYGVIALAVLILSCGGTIERTLERASWAMIAYIFIFLVTVNLLMIPAAHSQKTFLGFLKFGSLPTNVNENWLLLASLAATAGSGGIGNLTISNWIRDKGMGMGKCVGAIASAFGGHQLELSHTGKVFPITNENLRRWRTWWKYVAIDQVWLWGIGCFLGMYLNVNLATAIAQPGAEMEGTAAGAFQAKYMAQQLWSGLWYLGLLNGFWILFSTHLGNTDILVRTITDIVWVASDRVQKSRRLTIGQLYYALLFAFTAWGLYVVRLTSAMNQFKLLASIAGFVLVPASIQILIVNTRLLPREVRPSWWRCAALIACAIFYGIMSCLIIRYDVWPKIAAALYGSAA